MNKTISVNIGGNFFHIDESAYMKLNSYLDAVSHSLNDDPQGKEEILKDIELRISELLSEKISFKRQVVNVSDIDDIVKAMGQPEDYQYDSDLFNDDTSTNTNTRRTKTKKLYRTKKEGIIGGVCKGLAYYFGIDVIWVRLIMLLLLIVNGVGFLMYIILWIITPDATTTAEELEMKGEPVNIDTIEKNIKDEYSKLEKKVKETDFSNARNGIKNFIDGFVKVLQVFLSLMVKFIGVLLIIIGGLTFISLLFGICLWAIYNIFGVDTPYISYPQYFDESIIPSWILVFSLLFAIMVPFFYTMMLGINIISKKSKSIGFSGNLSLLALWVISLFILAFGFVEHQTKFAKENYISSYKEYDLSPKDTLVVKMSGNDTLVNRKKIYRSSSLERIDSKTSTYDLYSSNINIDIRRSNSSQLMVKILKTARGYTDVLANENASKIDYNYQLTDNLLDLNSYLLTTKALKLNKPKIDVIIYVPEEQLVFLDKSTAPFLNNVNNLQDVYDRNMVDHTYQMLAEGFNCLDCAEGYSDTKEGVKIKIDKNGVDINVDDGDDKARIKIDETGLEIR